MEGPLEGGAFETTVDVNAPVQEVFRHLTDPVAMIRWMGQHATLEPAPGGAFEVDINGVPGRGRYLEIDPPRRLLISWGHAGSETLPPGASTVEITLPRMTGRRCVSSTAICLSSKRASTRSAGRTSSGGWSSPAPAATPGRDPWAQTE